MGSVLSDSRGHLFIQLRFRGVLCREYFKMRDTRENRRELTKKLRAVEAALRLPDFDYAKWFPGSKALRRLGLTPLTAPVTLGNQARVWAERQGFGGATLRDYEYLFRKYLDRTSLGAMPLTDVKPQDIREAVKDVGALRRVTMLLQRLRSIYADAIADGIATRNPAELVRNPRRGIREPIDPFTRKEQAAILRAAEGQDRNLIAVMLGTGARPGELLALSRKDVDLKRGKLVISASADRYGLHAPKTAGSARVIEITDELAPVTTALRRQLATNRLRSPVFANESGGYLDFTNWRERRWRGILERAKVPYRSPYLCRHTFAVGMLEIGYDPVLVAKQMGHTSANMIHRFYGRWRVSKLSEQQARE